MTVRATPGTTHVVGGGLAGLSAALCLADAGRHVVLHEAGPACGGRCRSFHDRSLDARIDNGSHLLLSGNRAAFAFLDRIGTRDTLAGPSRPEFHFQDVSTGERWQIAPGRGRMPWWLLRARSRVPGTRLRDYAALLGLLRAGGDATVRDVIGRNVLADRLLDPLSIAILNTLPERGSARLLGAVFRDSLFRGGDACIPAFPREGLSETFVAPALAALSSLGATIRTGARVSGLARAAERVTSLEGPDGPCALGPDDDLVLAVPAPVAASLLPGLVVPDRFEAILNIHYRTDATPRLPALRRAAFVGFTGGAFAEWAFSKPGIVSVTVSAANRFDTVSNEDAARRGWIEAARGLDLDAGAGSTEATVANMPPWRVVREKRATFEATSEAERRRPRAGDGPRNVALAGDWTATGLPATIEGAITSGRTAAEALLGRARESMPAR